MLNSDTPLLVVVGPTASGKTALCVEVAERIGGEIVSADSVQVYRHFDIGTGKPSAAERARAPHHLVDIVEPHETLDAARWAALAEQAIREIQARGKVPIVCGGSFLWVRALIWGLSPMPSADPQLRARHQTIVANAGRAALHQLLAQVDPISATRLNENDVIRVSRALEVYELSGIPQSQYHAGHGFRTQRIKPRLVGLQHPRETQDARILARTQAMFQTGWVDEVRALLAHGYGDTRAMSAVGYKELSASLQTGGPLNTHALCETVYRKTRVFARRQRTWLRDQRVEWLTPRDALEKLTAHPSG